MNHESNSAPRSFANDRESIEERTPVTLETSHRYAQYLRGSGCVNEYSSKLIEFAHSHEQACRASFGCSNHPRFQVTVMSAYRSACNIFKRLCASVAKNGCRNYSTTMVTAARQVLALDGDGVGAEIVGAAKQVIDSVPKNTPIEWVNLEGYGYDNDKPGVTKEHLDTFDKHRVLLKGPITIPAGTNRSNITIGLGDGEPRTFTSPNQAMRKLFSLFANVRPAIKFQLPWKTRFDEVDVK